jgi:hypothetical protein
VARIRAVEGEEGAGAGAGPPELDDWSKLAEFVYNVYAKVVISGPAARLLWVSQSG